MEQRVEEILSRNYSKEFDRLRQNAMVTSHYKYGDAKECYTNKLVDAIESLEMRLDKYKKSGNTEWLVDVANFAMLEFMFPQHDKAHYRATDSRESPGLAGMSLNELNSYKEV